MKKPGKLWIVAVIGLAVGVLGGALAESSQNGRTFQDRSYVFNIAPPPAPISR